MPDVLAGTSGTVLNRNGENGHPCLVPSFREKSVQCFTADFRLASYRFCRCPSLGSFPLFLVPQRQRVHPPAQEPQETQVQALGQEDPLEKAMATHSSTLTGRIPWTEDPGGLQSTGGPKESDRT